MKKMFRNLMLVAVAAMAFTSCQKEANEELSRPQDVVMTIIADMDETRTYIDEANSKVNWSEGDKIKVIENCTAYRTSSAATIDGSGKAKFSVSFTADATSTSFTYDAIFPASSLVEDEKEKMNFAKVKVIVPEAQNPTATSFDPSADVLVAKHVTTNSQPTELSMQFKRLVALGKMTMTNFPSSASNINKVIFSVDAQDEEGEALSIVGRNYVDVENGEVVEYCYYGGNNSITLSYDNASPSTPVYFTCNPFELGSGDKFTVKVVCSDYTYTREVTLNKSLKFSEGDLSTFSVDMASATKEKSFSFANGDYAAIAVVNGEYYALSSAANGKRLNAVAVSFDGNSLTTADETLKWAVTKGNEGYTFKGSNNQYVAWDGSGNYANTQNDVYYLDITEDADNAGRYFVASKADAARKLQKNSNQNYFAFYTSSQSGSLYLVPVTIDANAGGGDSGDSGDDTGEVVKATVQQFLAAAEDSTIYELTGEITSVTNTTYANFYLKDSTGEVYIYGLCSPSGAQKYWAESGAKVGDTITVQTVRSSYNGSPQGKNAIFVSLVPGEGGDEGGETPEPPVTTGGMYESDAAFVCSNDDSASASYSLGATTIGGETATGFKLGTSKLAGVFKSAAIGVSGDMDLNFYAVAWKGKKATLYVRVDGGAAQSFELKANDGATGNPPYTALSYTTSDYYSVKLTGLTASSTIEFSTDASFSAASNSSSGRAILCGIKLSN